MEQIELELKLREGIGKGVSKKLRKAKNIPGIIYGNNEANVNVIAEETSFTKLISKQKGEHAILNIKIKDNSDSIIAEKNAIIKNLQRDAITEDIIHVDFQTISMDKKLRTNVPLVAQGKAEGIKSGGILEQLVHEITIECLPSDIPHQINLDITNLKINESYHIKDIPQNEKIRILSPQDMVLVVITTPGKEEVEKPKEELATQAQAEPEIVGKKGKAETPIEGAAETKETKEAKPAKETKKK